MARGLISTVKVFTVLVAFACVVDEEVYLSKVFVSIAE